VAFSSTALSSSQLVMGRRVSPQVNGIKRWVSEHPERDISTFIREAAREKLSRSGIPIKEAV
jgi:hypothetical protein